MKTVKILARLNICRCGAHGRIMLSNGFISREFYSLGEAENVLIELLQGKFVTEEEFFYIGEQIENSSCLPEKAVLADTKVCGVINLIEDVRSEKNELPSDYVM